MSTIKVVRKGESSVWESTGMLSSRQRESAASLADYKSSRFTEKKHSYQNTSMSTTDDRPFQYLEKQISIERFPGVAKPPLSLAISEKIERDAENYISHSSWAYNLNGSIYVATEATFKRPNRVIARRIPRRMDSSLEKMGMNCYGSSPSLTKETLSVTYMIYDTQKLILENQRGAGLSNLPKGGPVLTLGDKLVEFKEIEFPMTRLFFLTRFGSIVNLSPQYGLPIVSASKFLQPTWFRQRSSGYIVTSGSMVPDFFEICLSLKSPYQKGDVLPSLKILKVSVLLYEFLQYIPESKERRGLFGKRDRKNRKETVEPPSYEPSELFWSYRTLLTRECKENEWVPFSDSDLTAHLPSSLYNCSLPDLGPTFFTNTLSRGYGIEVCINYLWGGEGKTLVARDFSEIAIAKRNDWVSTCSIPKFIPPSNPDTNHHSKIVIEKTPRSLFVPNNISETAFAGLTSSYFSHRTDTFLVDDDIFAVTIIETAISKSTNTGSDEQRSTILSRYGLTEFGRDAVLAEHDQFIIVETVKESEVVGLRNCGTLVGDIFLETNGRRSTYNFPLHSPLHGHTRGFDYAIYRLPVRLPQWDVWVDLTFEAVPRGHVQHQEMGFASSGVRISQFLNPQLTLPFSFNEFSYLQKRNISFTITKVEITIRELVECCNVRSVRSRVIFSETRNYICRWGDFKDNLAGTVSKTLPSEVYDCVLPNLGPTFFSNEISRDYEIEIAISLKVDEDQHEEMLKSIRNLRIAAKNRACVSERRLLPPYEPQATPKTFLADEKRS